MIKRRSASLLAVVLALVFALSACGHPAANSLPSAPASNPGTSASAEPSAPPKISLPVATGSLSQTPETAPPEAEPSPSQALETTPPEAEPSPSQTPEPQDTSPAVTEDGWYNSKEDVALYIHLFGHLPDNYVTKREAQDLGWSGGSVERYAGEGTAIGGSRFGNYEGLLPEAKGRTYTECDIDTVGGSSRGGKRVVFSNDGLVYYTGDHYESFELLYGEP